MPETSTDKIKHFYYQYGDAAPSLQEIEQSLHI